MGGNDDSEITKSSFDTSSSVISKKWHLIIDHRFQITKKKIEHENLHNFFENTKNKQELIKIFIAIMDLGHWTKIYLYIHQSMVFEEYWEMKTSIKDIIENFLIQILFKKYF